VWNSVKIVIFEFGITNTLILIYMNISKRMSVAAKGIITFLSCAFLMVACVEPEDPTTDPSEPTVPTEPKSDVDIIADALLDCVTKDMDAPDRLKSKVEELKKLESVKDVEVGESALQVTFKDGSVTVFPYMYPSPFDYDGFVENITTKASIGLDTKATNGKKAAVFNGYSAFKQFQFPFI